MPVVLNQSIYIVSYRISYYESTHTQYSVLQWIIGDHMMGDHLSLLSHTLIDMYDIIIILIDSISMMMR